MDQLYDTVFNKYRKPSLSLSLSLSLSPSLSGPGPFPGVLDMWGGGGGLVEYRSALLASHGFASMALKYIDPGDTPTDMAMGYFEVLHVSLLAWPESKGKRPRD